MTNRVGVQREVFLNNQRYPLGGDGRVRTVVTSQYPQKVVFGDVDKDSNPRSSIIVWDDWTGGIGQYSTDGREGLNRSAFSTADGRHKNHLTLPPLQTTGASSGVAGITTAINEFNVKLYVALNSGRDIRAYTIASNSWGGSLSTPSAAVYDSIAFTIGTTDYLAFAHRTGYVYTSTPDTSGTGAWIPSTVDVESFAFWDDRLWGIDITGQLWYSTTVGTEINDAKLPLPDYYAHVLFVGPDARGDDILYVATDVGLWAHDAPNARFVRTKLVFPRVTSFDVNTHESQGACTWNGEIYITAGDRTVYRYDPGRGTIVSVGIDRDSGSPLSAKWGDIIKLIPTHTGLLAIMDGYLDTDGSAWEYNGIGWHYLIKIDASAEANHVSSIGGNYRLYHTPTAAADIGYVALHTSKVNPERDTINYNTDADVAVHITPWFNAGQNEIDKTAIRLRVDCQGMTSNETALVKYGLDYAGTYESSTFTITSNGITTKTFPTLADNNIQAGKEFRAIRFHITLNQSTSATATPNIKSLSLEWRRKIPAKYGFEFIIDRSESYNNKTPKKMKADLITAIESSELVEFTFVDDDGNTQNYFVDVTNVEDVEETGRGEIGQTRIAVVEI